MNRIPATRLWKLLVALTVVAASASLVGPASSLSVGCMTNADCGCTQLNCSAPGQGGVCVLPPLNSTMPSRCVCNPGYGGPACEPLGACCGASACAHAAGQSGGCAAACEDLTQANCLYFNGTFAGNGTTCGSGICDPSPTPTLTPTQTPPATPTATPTLVPQGGSCIDAAQCATGLFCSDAVCCDSACDGPQQACNLAGQQGVCRSTAAAAPAASSAGLAVMAVVLAFVGLAALALRRRRA